MKQAQAMQAKLAEAQSELAALVLLGQAGDGMVKVTLKGTGELARVDIDESLRPSWSAT
jgi:DNA-binding protein YbaB